MELTMANQSQAEARKADLLDRVRSTHARLERAVAGLTPEQMESAGTVGAWSVKVSLAHVTWWEQVPLHALRGEPDEDLLPNEEWSTDRANAVLFARNQLRRLDDVLAAFHASYAELLRALEQLPASRLDEPAPYGGTLYELVTGNTDQHYAEHAGLIVAAFGLQ
jgi:DinB superfamily